MGIHIEDVALRRSGSMYGYYGLGQVPPVAIMPLGPPQTAPYVPKRGTVRASDLQAMLKTLGFFRQAPTGYWGAVSGRAFDAWKRARGHTTFTATAANGHGIVVINPAEALVMIRKEAGVGVLGRSTPSAVIPEPVPGQVPPRPRPVVAVVPRAEPSEAAAPAPPAGQPWWAIGVGTLLSVASAML